MKRRDYLRLVASVTGGSAVGVTGCLSSGAGELENGNVYLEPPDEVPNNVLYPTYGEAMPEVELLDVFTGEPVSTAEEDEFLMTFIFTFCPTECIWLVSSLTHAEARVLERGAEEPRVLAATFDPARDTPERMNDYAERMGIDSDNWSLLRPEDEEAAEEVITGEFGVRFQKAQRTEGHGHDGHEGYDFIHTTLILLVNENGYVERSYMNQDPSPDLIADDWLALVKAQESTTNAG